MAIKRKGLGRGLDALLGGTRTGGAAKSTASSFSENQEQTDGQLSQLPVEYIQRGKYQPRRDMHTDALEELADSIKAQGVMQPIVVRPISSTPGAPKYEIIAGERRWRAAQLAGLDKIPAVVRIVEDDAAIAMALIENIQREDLNPIEEAVALKRLQDEFELTHQEVAAAVGKSRTTVTNLLRLMALSDEVKKLLEHGDLEMGHARALLTLNESDQREAAKAVTTKSLSVRQTEALVRRIQQQNLQRQRQIIEDQPHEEKPLAPNKDIQRLEERLAEYVGVPVQIQHTAKGKGRLVFKYNNLDELDGILNHLQFEQE